MKKIDTQQQSVKNMSLQEVALLLEVTPKSIYRWLISGDITGKFWARRWHFTQEDIEYYKNRQKREDTKGQPLKRKYTKKAQ